MTSTFSLIGEAFETFFKKENFFYLLRIILVQLLIGIVSAIPFFVLTFLVGGIYSFGNSPETIKDLPSFIYMVLAPLSIISVIAMIVVGVWMQASGLVAAVSVVKNEKAGVKHTLSMGWRRAGKLFLVSLLTSLIFGLGLLFFVIPGIIFAVWFSFAPLYAVEGSGVIESLKQSKALVKGHFWAIVLRFVALWLLELAVAILLSFIPVVGPIITILITPFSLLFYVLLFYDLKKLRES